MCYTEVSNDIIIWHENEIELNIPIYAGIGPTLFK